MNNLGYTVLRNGRKIAKRQFEAARAADIKKEAEEEKTPTLETIFKKLKKLDAEIDEIKSRSTSQHFSTGRIFKDSTCKGAEEEEEEEEEEGKCVTIRIRLRFSERE